ncbi:hypothetical protein BH10CHL1_BH10CHL1_25850 [soil metagenome]
MHVLLVNLVRSRIFRLGLFIPILMLLAVACMPIAAPTTTATPQGQATNTLTNTMTNTTTSTTATTGLPVEILGVVWQWQNSAVADPSKYTVQFTPEGRLLVQADCNRGSGAYRLVGQRLLIESVATTLMACLPDSLDHTFLEQLSSADGYQLEGDNLVLTLQVAPGITTFTPATSASQASGVLTGTVTYRQRIALPAGSVISVQLQDVSKQDVAATIVASQTMTTSGENVPLPFTLAYDPAQIEAKFTYALSVRITINGQLAWLNTERYAVLTNGAPASGIEVLVQPVR